MINPFSNVLSVLLKMMKHLQKCQHQHWLLVIINIKNKQFLLYPCTKQNQIWTNGNYNIVSL